MNTLKYTLLSDGSSDQALLPILSWLLKKNGVNRPIAHQWADFGRYLNPPKTLREKIARTLNDFPCDLLFIHRDAEKQTWSQRADEIQHAIEQTQGRHQEATLPVIPVHMTEAWLLFDEPAIRTAAHNPNGHDKLTLPPITSLEQEPDPKACLQNLLLIASGLQGRRRDRFPLQAAIRQIPHPIHDFSPLRQLSAFAKLEHSLNVIIMEKKWNTREPASQNQRNSL